MGDLRRACVDICKLYGPACTLVKGGHMVTAPAAASAAPAVGTPTNGSAAAAPVTHPPATDVMYDSRNDTFLVRQCNKTVCKDKYT